MTTGSSLLGGERDDVSREPRRRRPPFRSLLRYPHLRMTKLSFELFRAAAVPVSCVSCAVMSERPVMSVLFDELRCTGS